jgi:1-acyl-sn-glycerol-3-phosphate acyltransferase
VLGGPPPAGHRARSGATARDVPRTVRAAVGFTAPLARALLWDRGLRLPPATTSTMGLGEIAGRCLEILRTLRVDLVVEGRERVPAGGGLLLMWNQTSHLDHLVLPAAIPRPFHSLYNNELKATPLYGRYLETNGHFWIDRTDETRWRSQVALAAERIRGGACVLISPEGTRSWDGELLPMKRGAFILAREAAAPIVCATVIGAHERLPRGAFAVRPGLVRVVFSEPICVSADDQALEERVVETFRSAQRAHAVRSL